ncbi:hypothetical protein BDZ91DRAFT_848662 [Kalaharituber pfeilii]|nr:hypothetical protein BDZ91DRAFT_848662 [Kalaharituber pfeilii]
MAPVLSKVGSGLLVSVVLAALAGEANCESKRAETTLALNQLCNYPQLDVCRHPKAVGLIEERIQTWYKDIGPDDPRKEFLEAAFMTKKPRHRDPNYNAHQRLVNRYWEIIFDAQAEWREQREEQEKENPEKDEEEENQPLLGEDIINRDGINYYADLCCPQGWDCLTTNNDPDDADAFSVYCYNNETTSMMMTEGFEMEDKAGVLNLKDLSYTRGDGKLVNLTSVNQPEEVPYIISSRTHVPLSEPTEETTIINGTTDGTTTAMPSSTDSNSASSTNGGDFAGLLAVLIVQAILAGLVGTLVL